VRKKKLPSRRDFQQGISFKVHLKVFGKTGAMPDNLISVIDLAAKHGKLKQSIFKVLKKHRIEPTKRMGANNRGQVVSYVTQEEASIVASILAARGSSDNEADSDSISDVLLAERGVFFLLALEPRSDPGRFKVGFAASLPERLRQLRCSAPFAEVAATWPCKRLWEKTAIDCIAAGCERVHTEVFRTESIASVREKCERFFAMMPKFS
jgi:hypothetical protein